MHTRHLISAALLCLTICAHTQAGSSSAKAPLSARVDGWPNLPVLTMGGKQFWEDVHWSSGWRVQRNVITRHHRLLDPRNVRRAWGSERSCMRTLKKRAKRGDVAPSPAHLVVFLHGNLRSPDSFQHIMPSIEAAGFGVAGISYPSTRRTIEEHAVKLVALLDRLEGIEHISFVTHSMGGLVLRTALAKTGEWQQRIELERVVMIAPPSRGALMADLIDRVLPLADDLCVPLEDMKWENVRGLPAPPCPFAIVAGGKSDQRGWNPILPGDDDGIVAVREAWLPGADDFLVVDASHRKLLKQKQVARSVLSFLRHGHF